MVHNTAAQRPYRSLHIALPPDQVTTSQMWPTGGDAQLLQFATIDETVCY